jgi:perosamine synthetase
VGRVQLRHLPEALEAKRAHARLYRELLAEVEEVRLPPEEEGVHHSYQSFVLRLAAGVSRDEVIEAMAGREVETTIGTYALHAQPLYRHRLGVREGDYAVSWAAYRDSLALPLYPRMTEKDVRQVVTALKDAIAASPVA